MFSDRIERLRASMLAQGVDFVILTPSTDMRYVSGVNAYASERLTCCLIGSQKAFMLLPAFELPHVPQDRRGVMEFIGWSDGEDPFALLLPHMENARKVSIGRDMPGWALLRLQQPLGGCVFSLADELLTPMRAVKGQEERLALLDVHARSARAFERLISEGLCGKSEAQIARRLGDHFLSEGVALNMVGVASGPNSALAHHISGERVVGEGDVVWIDFGGVVPGIGYQSDITRTFAIKRAPDGFERIYETVRAANEAAFERAKPGVLCRDVDAAARRIIEQAGYGEYFTHRLGHGLGMDMHEQPYISPDSTRTVIAGNVFSDEPGIYIPGKFGVRIEDTLFINEYGAEHMTPLSRALMVIG